ncbi:beta strand repeat-containing protein [Bradyrhizobium monzae]|uniref:beta strand repeat-containing protein n=1 Tax=Bradyrhizobium sp. Oc8 TaxID=2876780 RepID=UPI001F3A804A|nr:calcium-binding protein [Bradyrhizobium sp. Oc8]
MASFTVASGTDTKAKTVGNGDTGVIDAGATLAVTASVAISWTGGTTEIDNFGTISAATRGIDTGKSVLAAGSSLTFDNAGGAALVSTANDGIRINADIAPDAAGHQGSVTVNNSGVIVSGSYSGGTISGTASGQALDFDNLKSAIVTINNDAGGLIGAADADAIRPGAHATINNWGAIVAQNGAGDSGNDGIDFQSNAGGGIVNNYAGGTIDGARHGITGEQPINVYNEGTITGHLGSGINMDTPSLSMTTVTNHGTIIGTGGYLAGTAVDGDGIDVDGLLALDNFGTIQATGVHVVEADGTIDLQEAVTIGGGTIINEAGGVITSFERAITVNDSDGTGGPNGSNGSNGGNGWAPTTILNWGLIHGGNGEAISITDLFADTVTNHGTIEGSVALGGGDDIVNDYTGAVFTSTIDGGDGTDTFKLLGNGSGTLAHTVNFEALDVQGGNWSVTDAESFTSGISIETGAGLAIADGGSLTGHVTDNGVLASTHSDVFVFNASISGNGSLDQAGTGTTVLSQTSSYTGGTTLHAGTLELAALGAAGTGTISFESGAQTLKIDKAALDHGHLDNTIEGFGVGDTIDLAGIGKATSATLSADNVLTVTGGNSGTIALQLDSHAYASGLNYQLSSDGHGGTKITVVSDNLVQGNDGNNLLIANLFSPVGSVLDGKGGNDILIGGLHSDVLNGGGGNDLLYGGAGADQFRFNGADQAAGQRATDAVFDLNFNKGDALVFYDYEAGTFASSGAHPTTVLNTGEGAGSGVVVNSMAALADLVKSAADVTAQRGGANDLVIDISQSNGSHETIVLDHQWQAYSQAAGGHFFS